MSEAVAVWYQGKQRRRRNSPAAMPDTITDLSATAISDAEVRLDFTEDAAADFHRARYRLSPSGPWLDGGVVESEDTISGLAADTAYDFQVRGYSERWGGGEWSSIVTEATDA